MKRNAHSIENIADTARWVTFYRAMESERPDAHFYDPYAQYLAGERGKEIACKLPWGVTNAWAIIVRTCVLDEIILKTVERHRVDAVINLAAGFDTRPYRLPLPSSLHWIEVDLPEIIDEKAKKLMNESPQCRLSHVKLDLADIPLRRTFFSCLVPEVRQILVVTEGLLVYLTAEQVASLACDLRTFPHFRWWLTDLVSPFVLRLYKLCWASELAHGNASFQFAPQEGERFFSRTGWHAVEFRSTMEEASRLDREMPFGSFWQFMVNCCGKEFQEIYRRMSGFLLLEQA